MVVNLLSKKISCYISLIFSVGLFVQSSYGLHTSSNFENSLSAGDLQETESVLGAWKYIGYLYQGHLFSPQDPELQMMFVFENERHVRLSWKTSGGKVQCARIAEYKILDKNILRQKNIWIDPKNHGSCQSDGDMVLGYESSSFFQIAEGEKIHPQLKKHPLLFELEVGLAEENLHMLFKKVPGAFSGSTN